MRLRRAPIAAEPVPRVGADNAPASSPMPEDAADPATRTPPPLGALFVVWLRIGALSIGGGASTLYMMRRELVQRHRWLTGEEYNEAFALSKLVPGINITAQTILMGRMIAGGWGAVVCLAGLLAPAVLLTSLFAATITAVQGNHIANAMLGGVVPAAGGLTFAIVAQMGGGQIGTGWARVRSLGLMLVFALAVLLGHLPVPVVLIFAGILGACFPQLLGVVPTKPQTSGAVPTAEGEGTP